MHYVVWRKELPPPTLDTYGRIVAKEHGRANGKPSWKYLLAFDQSSILHIQHVEFLVGTGHLKHVHGHGHFQRHVTHQAWLL